MKTRLDQRLVQLGLVNSRSQAESYIKLGEVQVAGKIVTKPGWLVADHDEIMLTAKEQYVSRAALKLASVTESLGLEFEGKTVLDVGSSTGGFTDYALRRGAARVIAVEVGKNQMHPSLSRRPEVELHEQTDIRDVQWLSSPPDIVLIDVSFISLREILPAVSRLVGAGNGPAGGGAKVVAMVKPQFEAAEAGLKHKGVIKNEKMRRDILKDFEDWARQRFVIIDKADSTVTGAKGNRERFYLLKKA